MSVATRLGEHAVVLGGSIAGLLAARVLTDSFARVTIVERDVLSCDSANSSTQRRGVPHAGQVHALLPRGRMVLDALFPELGTALLAHGATTADPLDQVRFFVGGSQLAQAPSAQQGTFASRVFLEEHLRAAVRALPSVTIVDGAIGSPVVDGDRVAGVQLRPVGEGSARTVDVDVVVDATGRGSRTPAWLTSIGRTAPAEDRVTVDVDYVSGRFRLRPGALGTDVAILIAACPGFPRAGALMPAEGDEVIAGVAGTLGDRPPGDLPGLLSFAATLAFPDLRAALDGAELLGPLESAHFVANRWRRYDRLHDLPAGLFVVGDALCAFNPVYGQGMSVAALEAEALHRLLGRGSVPKPRTFFRAAARSIGPAWNLAVGADLQDPRVEGRRTKAQAVLGAYVGRFQAAAARDAALASTFMDVSGLIASPAALLRPDRALRVLMSRST